MDTARRIWKDLLDYIQANAVQYRDVNVADENSLIALSTCSEAETNGRVVLIGKLERRWQKNSEDSEI
ncbi:MAG: hypothetical protein ACLR08_02630 [Dorea longicatena]